MKKLNLKNMKELSKEDLVKITGGDNFFRDLGYGIGYSFGYLCEIISQGLKNGFTPTDRIKMHEKL